MKIKEFLLGKIKNDKDKVLLIILSILIIGLAAHAFGLLNLNPSHDYLNEYYYHNTAAWKVSLGRFMAPAISVITGQYIVLPWVAGIIMFFSMAVSVYLISKMFNIAERWKIISLVGIFVTNTVFMDLVANFAHDLSTYSVALMLSTLAAYEWSMMVGKINWRKLIIGSLCVAFSLACYQSFLSVTIVLIMIKTIKDLIDGKKSKEAIKDLLRGALLVVIGAILYVVLLSVVNIIFKVNIREGTYNSLSNAVHVTDSIAYKLFTTYAVVAWHLFVPTNSYNAKISNIPALSPDSLPVYLVSVIDILLFVLCVAAIVRYFMDKKADKFSKILLFVLCAFMPLMMNIAHFLNNTEGNTSHTPMYSAFNLFYLLAIILGEYFATNRSKRAKSDERQDKLSIAFIIALSVIIILNIQFSNTLYAKKDLETKSTLSVMTRVLYGIESQEGYKYSETKVCIVDRNKIQAGVKGTQNINGLSGAGTNTPITYQEVYYAYFQNVMQYKINLCSASELKQIKESDTYQEMSLYPNANSIRWIDDIIVVKMR